MRERVGVRHRSRRQDLVLGCGVYVASPVNVPRAGPDTEKEVQYDAEARTAIGAKRATFGGQG